MTLGDDRAIRATYVAGKVASVDPRPGPAHGPPP